ncbi:serine hydrolase [Marivirga sp.]|uniref:serine hydrolase domain-containing protein n=1 Tax=Marivirga sp. TaxID=2018662 RepID=UPI0025D63413|nr:serine hydrolase domain-containing protein [Marivirga sp.]
METIIYDKSFGYADRDLKVPYSPEIANDIASISKQFSAAAILKLQEDGRLNIQDTLGKFLDNLSEQKRKITLHQLLTHTAGLPLYSGKDAKVVSKDDFNRMV